MGNNVRVVNTIKTINGKMVAVCDSLSELKLLRDALPGDKQIDCYKYIHNGYRFSGLTDDFFNLRSEPSDTVYRYSGKGDVIEFAKDCLFGEYDGLEDFLYKTYDGDDVDKARESLEETLNQIIDAINDVGRVACDIWMTNPDPYNVSNVITAESVVFKTDNGDMYILGVELPTASDISTVNDVVKYLNTMSEEDGYPFDLIAEVCESNDWVDCSNGDYPDDYVLIAGDRYVYLSDNGAICNYMS